MGDVAVCSAALTDCAGAAAEALLSELTDLHGPTCVQATVLAKGEAAHVAMGADHRGKQLCESSFLAAYCTAKPVLALAVLRLVDQAALSLDDPVGAHLSGHDLAPWIMQVTVGQLLEHSAGMEAADPVTARLLPPSMRTAWLSVIEPPDGHDPGSRFAYSEFGSWFVLGLVVESVTGLPYDTWCGMAVLDPYGISPEDVVLQPRHAHVDSLLERVAVTVDHTRTRPVPLLSEAGEESASEWNPAYGTLATSRGVAGVYLGLLEDLKGAGRVLSPQMAELMVTPRHDWFDPTLTRRTSAGLGVMCDTDTAGFASLVGPRAFGHYGAGGLRFAVADPDTDLVVVVLANAMVEWPAALRARERVSSAVAAALDP